MLLATKISSSITQVFLCTLWANDFRKPAIWQVWVGTVTIDSVHPWTTSAKCGMAGMLRSFNFISMFCVCKILAVRMGRFFIDSFYMNSGYLCALLKSHWLFSGIKLVWCLVLLSCNEWCWMFIQVFVASSAKYNEIGHPFGYLKASTSNQTVNLFVMPYNYPQLIPLLGMVDFMHCIDCKIVKCFSCINISAVGV